MVDLRRRVLAESENIENTLSELREAMARPERMTVELAAIATFVHNAYNGIENILKQVLRAQNIEFPQQGAWHKTLLEKATGAGVITEGLADELLEYLAFRHFFVHGYGIMLQESPLVDLATRLPGVWQRFQSSVARFMEK